MNSTWQTYSSWTQVASVLTDCEAFVNEHLNPPVCVDVCVLLLQLPCSSWPSLWPFGPLPFLSLGIGSAFCWSVSSPTVCLDFHCLMCPPALHLSHSSSYLRAGGLHCGLLSCFTRSVCCDLCIFVQLSSKQASSLVLLYLHQFLYSDSLTCKLNLLAPVSSKSGDKMEYFPF